MRYDGSRSRTSDILTTKYLALGLADLPSSVSSAVSSMAVPAIRPLGHSIILISCYDATAGVDVCQEARSNLFPHTGSVRSFATSSDHFAAITCDRSETSESSCDGVRQRRRRRHVTPAWTESRRYPGDGGRSSSIYWDSRSKSRRQRFQAIG